MGNDAALKKYREIGPVKGAQGMLGTVLIEFRVRCIQPLCHLSARKKLKRSGRI